MQGMMGRGKRERKASFSLFLSFRSQLPVLDPHLVIRGGPDQTDRQTDTLLFGVLYNK